MNGYWSSLRWLHSAAVRPHPCAEGDCSQPGARRYRRYCARLFADVDRRVDTLGVRDAGVPRVPGFPYLRVDRFTAALAERADSEPKRKAWWTRLAQLDEEARTAELSNAALDVDDLARCRVLLADADAAAFERLRAAATVPDDYSLTMRTLGLYPLARLPFTAGVTRWQGDTEATFAAPLATLPVRGQLVRFAVAAQPGSKLPAGADPLGVPGAAPTRPRC
jgi:hypothetical protein